jgi:hypothetical protein
MTFSDRSIAVQFARQFRSDVLAMQRFRAVIRQSEGGSAPANEEQLLQQIAGKLASGELRVCARKTEISGAVHERPDRGGPAFDASERRSHRASSARAAEDEDTFSDADLAAIAAAQIAAAEAGVPFCEECAKAALAEGRSI